MSDKSIAPSAAWRYQLALGAILLCALYMLWYAFDIQVLDNEFLQAQGNARHLREIDIPTHRGMLLDRHEKPLAISTPVATVWANPQQLNSSHSSLGKLAQLLDMSVKTLRGKVAARQGREFAYVHIHPGLEPKVMALGISGIYVLREFQRFYPMAEVLGHLLGFTNIDDLGQEGLELAFNAQLQGEVGKRQIIRDRHGDVVDRLALLHPAKPGSDVVLSIDRRIQYIAYRELKKAVQRHKAKSGSLIILDVRTGEVLAMVNQPTFNPNNRQRLNGHNYRNRAATDVFEPGSTVKPFTVAAALMSAKFSMQSMIDTSPGFLRIGRSVVRDAKNYGMIGIGTVMQKSSNVAVSKMALAMPKKLLWQVFTDIGFGGNVAGGFPGEVSGKMPFFGDWHSIDRATLAYGYGLSVSVLQLAQAYAVLGSHGEFRPISYLRVDEPVLGTSVMPPGVAVNIVKLLEGVAKPGGTGELASVPGYRVAGKTGTVKKFVNGSYKGKHYLALFAGLVPASDPRLAMVVMIDEPSGGEFYGGKVAAPVFSKVMQDTLRLLNVPPEQRRPDVNMAGLL